MQVIDPDWKVARVVEEHPQTWQVFSDYGCPDMRKGFFALMAKIMSIRNAARIHGIPLDDLMRDLEASIEQSPSVTGEGQE